MKRQQIIIKTSIIGIILNIFLVITKTIAGILANSLTIILEAVNNLTDIISSVVTIVGAKLAGRAPDREHPYGHGRIEYISTLAVGFIIMAAGIGGLKESIPKIITPKPVDYSSISIIIMIIAILVKIYIAMHFRKVGKKVKSDTLIASGTDAISDVALSSAALLSIAINMITGHNLDGYMSAIISCFIIKSSFEVLIESWRDLIGRRVDGELSLSIKKTILQFDNILGVYDIQLHNYGPINVTGSTYIEVPDELTAQDIHNLTRSISNKIYSEYRIMLTIGIYAKNTNTKTHKDIRNNVEKVISKYAEASHIHGFFVNDETMTIAFDIIYDYSYQNIKQSKAKISREIRKLYPNYEIIITADIDITE